MGAQGTKPRRLVRFELSARPSLAGLQRAAHREHPCDEAEVHGRS
jgi:hypothetical protein